MISFYKITAWIFCILVIVIISAGLYHVFTERPTSTDFAMLGIFFYCLGTTTAFLLLTNKFRSKRISNAPSLDEVVIEKPYYKVTILVRISTIISMTNSFIFFLVGIVLICIVIEDLHKNINTILQSDQVNIEILIPAGVGLFLILFGILQFLVCRMYLKGNIVRG